MAKAIYRKQIKAALAVLAAGLCAAAMPNAARATPVSSSLALNPFSQGTASLASLRGRPPLR